jgi:hypothetical protein
MLCYLCVHFWAISLGMAQFFGLGMNEMPYFVAPVALLTFVVAIYPPDPDTFERSIHGLIVPLGVWSNLGMALLMMLVARLRGLGRSS